MRYESFVLALFVTLLVTFCCSSYALTGTAFEKDTGQKKVLYKWKQTETKAGERSTVVSTFALPDGPLVATEETILNKGQIEKHTVNQILMKEKGFVEVKDGKVFFSYTKEGKTKTSEEKLASNFTVDATLVDYLTPRMKELQAGENVEVRYGVLDRCETVGFKFFKTEDTNLAGKSSFILKMKPGSFIIAALVDPLFFTFAKEGNKLQRIVGRTLPKQLVDGKWKDVDADFFYYWD